jgi:hypothetical protein
MPNRQLDDERVDAVPAEQDVLELVDDEEEIHDEDEDDVVDEDDEDAFEDDEEEDDEEEFDESDPTAEVGSEGGSPGEVLERGRSRGTQRGGSEATETWRPGERDDMIVNRRDETGAPKKRVP